MRKKLGEILIEAGLIDSFQLQAALGHQRQWGGLLGEIIVAKGFTTEGGVADCLAQQLRLSRVALAAGEVDLQAAKLVPLELAERHQLVAYALEGERSASLRVATADPTNLVGVDEVQFRTGKRVVAAVATPSAIARAIRFAYHGEPLETPAEPEPPRVDDREEIFDPLEGASWDVDEGLSTLAAAPRPAPSQAPGPALVRPPPATAEAPRPVLGEVDDALAFLGLSDGDPAAPREALARPTEVQAILDAIDGLAAGREAPPELARYVNPTQMFAALVRLLIRRGVVDEVELVEELHRK